MKTCRYSMLSKLTSLGSRMDTLRKLAAIGYDGIETDAPKPDDDLAAIARDFVDSGLPAACIGALQNIGATLLRPDRTAEEIRQAFAPSARLARLSGAGKMMYCCMDKAEHGETLIEFRDRLVERLSIAADLAAEEGVLFCYEPLAWDKGTVGISTEEGLEIVSRVNKPSLRLGFDTYHSAAAGENPADALQLTTQWLDHVHLSDIRHTANGLQRPLPGRGELDFGEFASALNKIGYTGWLGVEGHCETEDALAELRQSLEYVKSL